MLLGLLKNLQTQGTRNWGPTKASVVAALGIFPVGDRSTESVLSFDQEEGVAGDAEAAQKHGRDRNQRI